MPSRPHCGAPPEGDALHCGPTHFAGCACHEARRDAELASLAARVRALEEENKNLECLVFLLGPLPDYHCSDCGASGVKLWRPHQGCRPLRCAACACQYAKVPMEVDEAGTRPFEDCGFRTDNIGWQLPAIPAEPDTFWGYTSVPESGVAWWKALPLAVPDTDRAAQVLRGETG